MKSLKLQRKRAHTSFTFALVLSLVATQSCAWALPNVGGDRVESVGVLYRFNLSEKAKTHSERVQYILNTVEAKELDIWQITPHHIDIYQPYQLNERHLSAAASSQPEWPKQLLSIPHTSSEIPSASDHYSSPPLPRSAQSSDPHSQFVASRPQDHRSRPISSVSTSSSSPFLSSWNLTSLNTTFHSSYHPPHEIDIFMHELAETYPEWVKVVHLGHSAEGREMLGLRISSTGGTEAMKTLKKGKDNGGRLGFVIVGAQHAREWVATATALYLAHALVVPESEKGSLRALLDGFDFHIIPSPNPDGYAYTWESDRFWYKNRQVMGPNAKCVGLDMNRNWGYKWKPHAVGGGDTFDEEEEEFISANESYENATFHPVAEESLKDSKPKAPKTPESPCSHWYPGHHAFESPEVNNIANYMTMLNGHGEGGVKVFLDVRSYGQMLSSPFSYTCKAKKSPRDAEDQFEAAMGAVAALGRVWGTTFSTGTLCEQLYKAPGNAIDYMYKRAGIKYSYAVHLRDTGTYGFSLPASWILPVSEETAALVEYLVRFVEVRG